LQDYDKITHCAGQKKKAGKPTTDPDFYWDKLRGKLDCSMIAAPEKKGEFVNE